MSFEWRTYQAAPGKMDALLRRFRDHTVALFAEHGIESIGYWIADEDPDRLVYLVRHDGDAEANWEAFRADSRWIAVRDESQVEGSLTTSIEFVRLQPTDFSALR